MLVVWLRNIAKNKVRLRNQTQQVVRVTTFPFRFQPQSEIIGEGTTMNVRKYEKATSNHIYPAR